MSRMELYLISFVVLGLVARDGPLTPYGLKQAVSRGPGQLWRFPHTQLYTEPARLADAGLLVEEREQTGRRRKTYTITTDGHRALRAWLAEAPVGMPMMRDEAMMKLYFGAFASTEDLRRIARAQSDAFRQHHEELLEGEARLLARGDRPYQLAVLRFGLQFSAMAASFWDDVAGGSPAG